MYRSPGELVCEQCLQPYAGVALEMLEVGWFFVEDWMASSDQLVKPQLIPQCTSCGHRTTYEWVAPGYWWPPAGKIPTTGLPAELPTVEPALRRLYVELVALRDAAVGNLRQHTERLLTRIREGHRPITASGVSMLWRQLRGAKR